MACRRTQPTHSETSGEMLLSCLNSVAAIPRTCHESHSAIQTDMVSLSGQNHFCQVTNIWIWIIRC
jgi:hypothetical protein